MVRMPQLVPLVNNYASVPESDQNPLETLVILQHRNRMRDCNILAPLSYVGSRLFSDDTQREVCE